MLASVRHLPDAEAAVLEQPEQEAWVDGSGARVAITRPSTGVNPSRGVHRATACLSGGERGARRRGGRSRPAAAREDGRVPPPFGGRRTRARGRGSRSVAANAARATPAARVGRGGGRDVAMERGVETSHGRKVGKRRGHGGHRVERRRLMERRKRASSRSASTTGVKAHRTGEHRPAVDHAVGDRVRAGEAPASSGASSRSESVVQTRRARRLRAPRRRRRRRRSLEVELDPALSNTWWCCPVLRSGSGLAQRRDRVRSSCDSSATAARGARRRRALPRPEGEPIPSGSEAPLEAGASPARTRSPTAWSTAGRGSPAAVRLDSRGGRGAAGAQPACAAPSACGARRDGRRGRGRFPDLPAVAACTRRRVPVAASRPPATSRRAAGVARAAFAATLRLPRPLARVCLPPSGRATRPCLPSGCAL